MKTKILSAALGFILLVATPFWMRADQVEMQNGERFAGKVLSVSASIVVFKSETLGVITVPRAKVALLAFGTNTLPAAAAGTMAKVPAPVIPPTTPVITPATTNANLSALLNQPGLNTGFIKQIRDQMLGGSPEATSKYDAMVADLLNGKLDLNGLRREAQSSVDQIRELKRELGPDAGDSLDGYLTVLNSFLNETTDQPASAAKAPSKP